MAFHTSHKVISVPSHHPRDYNDDVLDYRDYTDAFFNQIEALKITNTGISFGIFGDWGIGKSSMLRMIQNKLLETNKYLVVEFDAWRYIKQEDLWLAFLRNIIAAVETKSWWELIGINWALQWTRIQKSPQFYRKLWRSTLYLALIIVLIYLFSITVTIVITRQAPIITWLLAGGSGVALLFSLLIKFYEIIFGFVKTLSVNLPDIVKPGFDQGQSISIDNFREDFQTIVRKVGKKQTIVVLIDDLDRCPPNQVVPVLEAIKHFGFDDINPNKDYENRALIVFVLAIDRDAIERSVRGYFKDYFQNLGEVKQKDSEISLFAREYVEKIIQVHFELPPLATDQLGQLLDAHLDKALELNPALDTEAAREASSILILNPTSQPRAVMQAYSAFLNRWEIIQQRNLQDDIDPKTLAVLLVTQYVWPDVFGRIYNYPQHFFYLHALTTGRPNPFCSNTEIDECRELGFVIDEQENQYDIFRQNKFAQLMGKLDISSWEQPIKKLQSHLLYSNQEQRLQTQPEQLWEVLQSGDPVRIKYILHREQVEVRRIFRKYIIGYLAELTDRVKNNKDLDSNIDTEAAEKTLVVAGITIDKHILPTVVELLQSNKLPLKLQARALYTIGHFAANQNELAVSTLMNLIHSQENIPIAMQVRSAHLLRHCSLGQDNIITFIKMLREVDKIKE